MANIHNEMRKDIAQLILCYKFAIEEMTTKINILQEEFRLVHEYSPIEHVGSRLKSPKSILKKIEKKKIELTTKAIEQNIHDIAGIRIVCAFEEDIYRVAEMLCKQNDVTLVATKDYIKNPKGNGYRSLHLIIKIPIFLSTGKREVFVELQIRTIAMDFWASLEHKIYYKYNKVVPQHIKNGLADAANQANALDAKMASLNREINILKKQDADEEDSMENYIRDFIGIRMQQ